MNRRDALNLVGMLGHDLGLHPRGGQYMSALLVLTGMSDSPAADLAGALGVPEDLIENAHADVRATVIAETGEQAAHRARLLRERLDRDHSLDRRTP